MTADFDSQEYKDFLYELHCTTCIDLIILDNLIKLKLINSILIDPEAIQISPNGFFLNKYNIQLKENYTQLPEFIFASYPLYNPNFNVQLFQYMDKNIYYLSNYNFDNLIFLDFKRGSFSNQIYIDVFFNINLNLFFDKSFLLSEEEKEDLYFLIRRKMRYKERIQDFSLNSKKYLFIKKTSSHTDIDTFINLNEENILKSFDNFKLIEKDKIDQLFECALLRNQIINF